MIFLFIIHSDFSQIPFIYHKGQIFHFICMYIFLKVFTCQFMWFFIPIFFWSIRGRFTIINYYCCCCILWFCFFFFYFGWWFGGCFLFIFSLPQWPHKSFSFSLFCCIFYFINLIYDPMYVIVQMSFKKL